MLEVIRSPRVFDAIVVGSGATGGWAAKELTEAGMSVVVIEAGSTITAAQFASAGNRAAAAQYRTATHGIPNRPIQRHCYACDQSNYEWFVSDTDNPYIQHKPFHWIRIRRLGGRTLSWGRQCYRMSDLDLKAATHDGYGLDWPLSYSDLAPYYDYIERYMGVSGFAEGLPHLPDGVFLPPMDMTTGEVRLREIASARFGWTLTIGRTATLTKPHNGRSACTYCGSCERGCATLSYFASPWTTLADALQTGRLTVLTDAIASNITFRDGRADGVEYIDAREGCQREVRARIVLLCASTLESTRLLLLSGRCNSSGVLGRYLMDHISGGGAAGMMLNRMVTQDDYSKRPTTLYVPRFRNLDRGSHQEFIRGYAYQLSTVPAREVRWHNSNPCAFRPTSFQTKVELWGECLPRFDNMVTLDSKVDAWGIPVLRVSAAWSKNEYMLWKDGREQAAELLEAAGARNIVLTGCPSIPGDAIHEMGTARMGDDSRTSVVNRFCHAHDVPNIFVTDGACWVSSGSQNPTLTMMAITVRSCRYIIHEYTKSL